MLEFAPSVSQYDMDAAIGSLSAYGMNIYPTGTERAYIANLFRPNSKARARARLKKLNELGVLQWTDDVNAASQPSAWDGSQAGPTS
jgi:hypothetical protein